MPTSRHPTPEELKAAAHRLLPDLLAPGLRVLFCGINPSLYSAAVGHHFARPGNRFWPTLHAAGFTPRQLAPSEQEALLPLGYGITNVVPRPTAAADELTPEELRRGGRALEAKVGRLRPRILAVLGLGAWRAAFGHPRAVLGEQPESWGTTCIWVLPNPSGLNAHYQLADLARLFRTLREAAESGA